MGLVLNLRWVGAFCLCALGVMGWMAFGPWTLGNDYQIYQVVYAQIYRYYLTLGIEPMWYPHLEGGIPFGLFASDQSFNILGWLTSHIPAYWTGSAINLVAYKDLALLALAQGFSFYFLRRTCPKIPSWITFLISFILIYQARTLDATRYGTYLDAFVFGHCLALSYLLFLETPTVPLFLALVVFTQNLMTAGYETMIPFFLFMMVCSSVLFWKGRLKAIGLAAIAGILGAGLSAPHWMPLFDALRVNSRRSLDSTMDWAEAYRMIMPGHFPRNFTQFFYNLISPWYVDVHSVFAGSAAYSVLILATFFVLIASIRKNWFLLVLLSFPFFYAVGSQSFVFPFFYKYVPLFKNFRVPGRIFAVLPFIFCLIISIRYKQKINLEKCLKAIRLSCVLVLLGSVWALYLVNTKSLLIKEIAGWGSVPPEQFWYPQVQRQWLVESILIGIVGVVLTFNLKRIKKVRLKLIFGGALAILLGLQTTYLFKFGTWIELLAKSPTWEEIHQTNNLPNQKNFEVFSPMIFVNYVNPSFGTATQKMVSFLDLTKPNTHCFLPFTRDRSQPGTLHLPWYLTRNVAVKTIDKNDSCQVPTYAILNRLPENMVSDSKSFSYLDLVSLNKNTVLRTLTPNRIEIEIDAPSSAIFVSGIPLLPQWSVMVDQKPASALEVNGGLIGVLTQPGRHLLTFQYYTDLYLWAYLAAFISGLVVLWILVDPFLKKSKVRFQNRLILYGALEFIAVFGAIPLLNGYFHRHAEKSILMTNNYPEVLKKQLETWQKSQ